MEGTEATMKCTNYGVPHAGNRIIVSVSGEQVSASTLLTYQAPACSTDLLAISITAVQFHEAGSYMELTDESVDSGGCECTRILQPQCDFQGCF